IFGHGWRSGRGEPCCSLKNAIMTFFNLAKCGAKLRTEAQNIDVRRYFGIASLRCSSPSKKSTGRLPLTASSLECPAVGTDVALLASGRRQTPRKPRFGQRGRWIFRHQRVNFQRPAASNLVGEFCNDPPFYGAKA